MVQIGEWIDRAITGRNNESELDRIRHEVRELCEQFELYPHLKTY